MFAIKVIPNKRKPNDWFLLRDPEDFVVNIYTRKTTAEQVLKKLQHNLSKNVLIEITEDINPSALARATAKRQKVNKNE
jgi:hypothetical protein